MPKGDLCPIVYSYVTCTKSLLSKALSSSTGPYPDFLASLDALAEEPLAQVSDRTTQRLRGFHCLESLIYLLDIPIRRLERTREGIQYVIDSCTQMRNSLEIKICVHQLSRMPGTQIFVRKAEATIKLIDSTLEAARILRPRLRNDESLAAMGRLYVQGVSSSRRYSIDFVRRGRSLINVVSDNKGEPCDYYRGGQGAV